MAVVQSAVYEEILDFLATGPSVEQIIAFQPSETLKERSHYLMEQNQQDRLTADERIELEEILRMNHLVNMLKIKARQKLTQS